METTATSSKKRKTKSRVSNFSTATRIFVLAVIIIYTFVNVINLVNCGGQADTEAFYKLLGVSKSATTKQIRQAFKKLALAKHPDKNRDDPKANENFMQINKAYETLKDEEMRKKYDAFGEDGLNGNQNSNQHQQGGYQSWNFYNQNFGIYDEDAEIVTLSRSDFMQSVEANTDTIWFVNFYSTQCSHCHELAPTWRELAKQLDGVVKIGAVNCMDDWALCNTEQIPSFPSLIMYPARKKFTQEKTLENLLAFAMQAAQGTVHSLTSHDDFKRELTKKKKGNSKSQTQTPWLVLFCLQSEDNWNKESEKEEAELNYELNCLENVAQKKLAVMLHGLVQVASIDCIKSKQLCATLKPSKSNPIVYYPNIPLDYFDSSSSSSSSSLLADPMSTALPAKIVEHVMVQLPAVPDISWDTFEKEVASSNGPEKPWLVQFVNNKQEEEDDGSVTESSLKNLEYKRLGPLLGPEYNFARVNCHGHLECQLVYQLHTFPTFVLFKKQKKKQKDNKQKPLYEIYYSQRVSAQDLSKFVKDNADTPCRTLTDLDLTITDSDTLQFVDFFAPWCPPCQALLPEFRKASRLHEKKNGKTIVLFGTIDCTVNTELCQKHDVRSYPTTMLFNGSTPNKYQGSQHDADALLDFIDDVVSPAVVVLTADTFKAQVATKPLGKIWLVDFYASWCGPCQQLAPEWRKLAKKLAAEKSSDQVQVGMVDCVIEKKLCEEQRVTSYPNVRIYKAETLGDSAFEVYQQWMRDVQNMYLWAVEYFPSVSHKLTHQSFSSRVLDNEDDDGLPWLIDFYAPWCGHCQVFAPEFERLAEHYKGRVNMGKVNCQVEQYLCQMAMIQGYPTIRFYAAGSGSSSGPDAGQNIQAYDYEGARNVLEQLVPPAKKLEQQQKKDEL